MSKREAKFSASWSEKYEWISKDKNCVHSARCILCSKSFSIRNGGISDVNQHSKTAIHIKIEKEMRSQCTFKTSAGSLTGRSKPTTKDQILKAEILQALNLDKNHSFSSGMVTVTDSKKCSRACKLLRNILNKKQNPNVVQFALAPFVKDELITGIQKTPYSFKFDETTTSQVKKQYDG